MIAKNCVILTFLTNLRVMIFEKMFVRTITEDKRLAVFFLQCYRNFGMVRKDDNGTKIQL